MSPYLTDYLYYSSENKAERKFHLWAGLFCLSVALSRRCWYQQGDWRLYPCLYIFFVGPPGDAKSTAMSFAQKLVQDFTDNEIAPDQITRESLTEFMGQEKTQRKMDEKGKVVSYTPLTIFADELVIFLGAEPSHMVTLLTGLYNSAPTFRVSTKNKGKDHIPGPYVALLGCITNDTINNFMADKLITGGFSRRLIPVCSSRRGVSKPRPKMTPDHYAARDRCLAYCKLVQQIKGEFLMTPEAEQWFDDWFIKVKEEQYHSSTNSIMQNWFGSKDAPLIKLAMWLSVAESLDLSIKKEHLVEALRMLDETEPDMLTLLGGGGRNELAPIVRRIEKMVSDAGDKPISDKRIKLELSNHATDDEIMQCLRHLVDVESISESMQTNERGSIRYYRPINDVASSHTQPPATPSSGIVLSSDPPPPEPPGS